MKKKVFSVLSVCFFSLVSLAQSNVVIKGRILGAFTDTLFLSWDKQYLGQPPERTSLMPQNELFEFHLTTDECRIVELKYKNQRIRLFVEPGNELVLNFAADSIFQNVKFSGTGAENNYLLKDFYSRFEKDFNDTAARKNIAELGIDEFENGLFHNRAKQKDFIKASQNSPGVSETAKKFIDSESRYFYFGYLLSYPFLRNPNPAARSITPLPSVMTENLDKGSYNSAESLSSPAYRNFLLYFVKYQSLKANGFNYSSEKSSFLLRENTFASQALQGKVYSWWLAKTLLDECENAKPETVKLLLKTLSDSDKKGDLVALAGRKCGAVAERKTPAVAKQNESQPVDKNNARYPVTMKNLQGKDVLLDEFKGKVVYIDFWASWCGPCRGQFPFSKTLHERFSEKELKNIVFLYISIDDNESSWKAAIQQNQLNGTMLRSAGGWNSAVCRFFHISSIPRYMLMDKNGDIINNDAPRPSDESIYNEIKKLLE